MSASILDNHVEIKKLDSQNMLGSLELLGAQIEQVRGEARKVKIPASYKKFDNLVFLGMGGSTLGAHIIKTLFQNELCVPVEIVNDYRAPAFVGKNSLVVVSSYSGNTEEPLVAMQEALKLKAKILVITSGGQLEAAAKKAKVPALVFGTKNNPCGSPRMGLGYSIFGQIILLSRANLLSIHESQLNALVATLQELQKQFGVSNSAEQNFAKQLAVAAKDKSVWYIAAEHLAGNAHVAANQMNENAKRFAGYFFIPELNHHLLEGMKKPESNKDTLLFTLIESGFYDKRIQKRFEITKSILEKSGIAHISYVCRGKNQLMQAAEVLLLSSYASYYSAILEGIDPTAIPLVDFFKEQLKK